MPLSNGCLAPGMSSSPPKKPLYSSTSGRMQYNSPKDYSLVLTRRLLSRAV
jgi:hypothetical protein